MFRGGVTYSLKKHSSALQLAQLLLAVGLLHWRLPIDFSHGTLYEDVHSTSLHGSLDAIQLRPFGDFRDVTSSPSIHPKDVNLYLDGLFDRSRLLARGARPREFIAYIAGDESPARIDLKPSPQSAVTVRNETDSDLLSREDADLIEILWKQDVDLGIPFDDYRPANLRNDDDGSIDKLGDDTTALESIKQSVVAASTKKEIVLSIDSETGEPIFEPSAGPSTQINSSAIDLFLRDHEGSELFSDMNALIGAVNEDELMGCDDSDWNRNACYAGSSSISAPVVQHPSYNGSDPYAGVLLQNASLPNAVDAYAPNTTTSMNSNHHLNNNSFAEFNDGRKSTVSDHQALRDLWTYNSSAGTSNWDALELFQGELDNFQSNVALIANDTHAESVRYPTSDPPRNDQSGSDSRARNSQANNSDGNEYAGSDTGVSSMYSDEGPEEAWSESSSNASHDRDGAMRDANYQSNSSALSFGSMEAGALPQKKYKFFGRKPYSEQCADYSSDIMYAGAPRLTPAMEGLIHNHSYGQPNEFPANMRHELKLNSFKAERTSSSRHSVSESGQQNDGYLSSDPSEASLFAQITSARDERRARDLNIPIPPEEIVTLSIDEFNERLARLDLTEEQQALIRDIRRRGKNKVAAQNCRKRKLDQISALQGEVDNLHETCSNLENENTLFSRQESRALRKIEQLKEFLVSSRSGAIPKHSLKL